MKILKITLDKIFLYFKNPIPEKGGIIGSRGGIITNFEGDKSTESKRFNQYVPNIKYLNSILEIWKEKNISFAGIIHSHPLSQMTLSHDDIEYIYKILESVPCEIQKLYFPIITKDEIISYEAYIANGELNINTDAIEVI